MHILNHVWCPPPPFAYACVRRWTPPAGSLATRYQDTCVLVVPSGLERSVVAEVSLDPTAPKRVESRGRGDGKKAAQGRYSGE
jgi:hypothetical protein